MKIEKETTRKLLEYYSELYHFPLERNRIFMMLNDFSDAAEKYSAFLNQFKVPFHFSFKPLDMDSAESLGKTDWIFRDGVFCRIIFYAPYYILTEDFDGHRKWYRKSDFFRKEEIYFLSAEPFRPFTLGEKEISPEKRILSLIRLESSDIGLLTVFSIFAALLSLVIPVGTQSFVNILAFGTQMQPVIVLTFLITGALTFAGVLKILQMTAAEILQQRLFARVFTEIIAGFPESDKDSFLKTENSRKLNYLLDISTAQKSATVLLTDGLAILLQMTVGIIVLLLYHPIFIIYDVFIIILCYFVTVRLGKDGVSTSILESKYKHKTVFWLEEAFEKFSAIQGRRGLDLVRKKAEGIAGDYLHYRGVHFHTLKKQASVFILFQAVGTAVLLGMGGYLVIKGEISLGQFVASEIIAAKIMESFSKSAKYLESYYDLCASLDKISHALESGDSSFRRNTSAASNDDRMEFRNASFSVSGKTFLVNDILMNKGDSVSVKGENSAVREFFRILCGSDIRSFKTDSDMLFWAENSIMISSPKFFSGPLEESLNLFTDRETFSAILKKLGIYSRICSEFGEDFHSLDISEFTERLNEDDLFLFYTALVWRNSVSLAILCPPGYIGENTLSALNSFIQNHGMEVIVIHCNDKIISNKSFEIMERKKDE
ncbi:MAG TPA: ABC transporter transmembrane domain-containing protein [Leptospiraceae bacterium]|nr:ABC transporter transmembrane domain-containing protein [Leptospiraceae bacterium]HNF23205.1 ABC transporter transmembrane domain-containing protein [Leptospiraceae bacterium]HNM03292.1 ABC transporter transmembrane domain-containing protein [Leptospiraceae bacterium]HNO21775.1 ABC transporter transmembrane domain-containing protein [Leptospiraceae bacterium]